ncbi:hypothetical protein [Coleofasciculus sp. FACHB-129]|uniref:hypothetical protein n=1 Tax=Cyanophyceae TaxID=3028117 RepID=UPI001689A7A0|nr:hypothetical protein [Coleofasciculus sp. FACHB-129]MBD1895751.1 hypothetical protein [Coleofasciculus sp. FACHB-129]
MVGAIAIYDIQLVAAMQCLGYTKEQFQFIIVQPIKLYAFHKPTQQIHPIPNIPTDELIQAVGMDVLRWHSFSVPLTDVAPSTSVPPDNPLLPIPSIASKLPMPVAAPSCKKQTNKA